MIGYLSGKLNAMLKDRIILNVNGVGYELIMPAKWLLKHKQSQGNSFSLYVHTAAKDNDISLYGLPSLEEKIMFSRLLKVSSVGPKTALLVLSTYHVQAIEKAVEEQNIKFFLDIKGLAKKTSQKIIIELRSQFKALQKDSEQESKEVFEELILVLKNMSFSPDEIKKVLPRINKKSVINNQIKQALKLLS